MKLTFKKPSKKARQVMCEAAMHGSAKNRIKFIQDAETEICNITGHEYSKIVNSGNSAILTVMSTFKEKILIPDQGGWIGFKNIAEFLGLETIEVPTKLGVLDPEVISDYIHKYKPEAVFMTSFAGYIAEQPVKEIYDICEDKNVILVEDASGGIGDEKKQLGNGNHAHVIIASTGFPKIINVGNGGFISTNDEELLKKSKNILKTVRADPVTCSGISEEAKTATLTLVKTIQACKLIKKEFKSSIYGDERGITVALRTDNPKKIGYELRKRLNVEGRSIISICPRYERLMVDAVCLEIKNLDLRCLRKDNLKEIINNVKEIIE